LLGNSINELREELEERFSRLNGSVKSAEARIASLERRLWRPEHKRGGKGRGGRGGRGLGLLTLPSPFPLPFFFLSFLLPTATI